MAFNLQEYILFRLEVQRELFNGEVDTNFKMVANPWVNYRVYEEGNIVYHPVEIEPEVSGSTGQPEQHLAWWRANRRTTLGVFLTSEWDLIGGIGAGDITVQGADSFGKFLINSTVPAVFNGTSDVLIESQTPNDTLKLVAGPGISLLHDVATQSVRIDNLGATGEVNNGVNIGLGPHEDVYDGMAGTDLSFKGFTASNTGSTILSVSSTVNNNIEYQVDEGAIDLANLNAGSSTMDMLSDVSYSGLANGDLLQWVSGSGEWQPVPAGSIGSSLFDTDSGVGSTHRIGNPAAVGNYSTISGGQSNQTPGNCATVSGGSTNCADGTLSVVGGGKENCTIAQASTIAGGCTNSSSGDYGSIGGGCANIIVAGSTSATIGGGQSNCVEDDWSTVGGGRCNTASGASSVVSGGEYNTASGICSTVSGGYCNIAACQDSTVGGGANNETCGNWATIGGGTNNAASQFASTIGGGQGNQATCIYATVGGGLCNTASGIISTVGGGVDNIASGGCSVIAGGSNNAACCVDSTVGGGFNNTVSGCCSTIGGGACNAVTTSRSTISGGYLNCTTGQFSTVAGGCRNEASGVSGFVGGGACNTAGVAFSFYNSIAGGCSNDIGATSSAHIGGGNLNTITGNFASISGGCLNSVTSCFGFIGGGAQNCATSGNYASIASGRKNCNEGFTSFIGGGEQNYISSCGLRSNIVGGLFNCVCGPGSSILGGICNIVNGTKSKIGGGNCNTVDAWRSSIEGGFCNYIQDYVQCIDNVYVFDEHDRTAGSNIGGGNLNKILFDDLPTGWVNPTGGPTARGSSTIAGGRFNTTYSGYYGAQFIGGGIQNTACCDWTSIMGGRNNLTDADFATIGGGAGNRSCGEYGVVGGGCRSCNYDLCSVISGGSRNIICQQTNPGGTDGRVFASVISGGHLNRINTNSGYSCFHAAGGNTISGGYCNTISACYGYNTISGGCCSYSEGNFNSIAGGLNNKTCNSYGFAAGCSNQICGLNASRSFTIGGGNMVCNTDSGALGCGNCVTCSRSFAIGCGITTCSNDTTHVNCLNMKDVAICATEVTTATLPLGTVYYRQDVCALSVVCV